MEQESIFVGIDVAKAQLDVAVRPAADRWEVSHDDAGNQATRISVEEPGTLPWCWWRRRAAWNCPLWQLWRPGSCRWSSSTPAR